MLAELTSLSNTIDDLRRTRADLQRTSAELQAIRSRVRSQITRSRHLVDCGTQCLIVTDRNGIIRRANRTAGSHFAVAPDRLVGYSLPHLVVDQDQERFRVELQELDATRNDEARRVEVRPRAGQRLGVSLQGIVRRGMFAHVDELVWLLSDCGKPFGAEGFSLTLAARPQAATIVRRAVQGFAAKNSIPEERVFEIQVAIGEAVANAILHAYSTEDGGAFRLKVWTEGAAFLSEVEDYGRWDYTSPQGLGAGLRVIKALADEVTIRRGESGTSIRMRFVRDLFGSTSESSSEATKSA